MVGWLAFAFLVRLAVILAFPKPDQFLPPSVSSSDAVEPVTSSYISKARSDDERFAVGHFSSVCAVDSSGILSRRTGDDHPNHLAVMCVLSLRASRAQCGSRFVFIRSTKPLEQRRRGQLLRPHKNDCVFVGIDLVPWSGRDCLGQRLLWRQNNPVHFIVVQNR